MLYCYDNETIKWENDGVNYCLHIWADNGEECNPRDCDHDSIMACFYGRYRLGDAIDSNTPEEFWNNLVWKYCDDKEVLDALVNKSCLIHVQFSIMIWMTIMTIGQSVPTILNQTIGFRTRKNIVGRACFMMTLFSIREESSLFVIA